MVFKKFNGAFVLFSALILAGIIPVTSHAVERYEVIQYGDKDDEGDNYVLRLQKELYARGYMETEPTGYFGKETQKAISRYQERHELESDGKAGPKTQQAIFGKYYETIKPSRKVINKEESSSSSSGSSSGGITKRANSFKDPESIGNGDEGSSVTKIQKRLKELGYYTYRKTTTYYGDITEGAVEEFQRQNGLNTDGVVGKKTSKLLYSSKAKKYDKKKASSSSSSSSKSKSTGAKKQEETAKSQSSKGKTKAEKVINLAKSLIGKRYRTGGTGPNTFDCSGFIYYCLKANGMSTPRTSSEMSRYSSWPKVDKSSLRAGDLIFFTSPNSGGGVGHVGMYIGGGKFIHSSSGKAKGVTISSLSGSYSSRYKWARRPFK